MRAGLDESYHAVTAALDEEGIPYFAAEGGYFFLCDFRQFMTDQTWEAEDALWHRILDEANVNLTPGAACRNGQPGFFRVCFATEPAANVVAAVHRVAKVLG